MPCRLNRLRLWQGRLLLESTQHPSSLFVTLTYDEAHLPFKGWLKPVDLQRFMKRLRKNHGQPIRFFAVGEYGDQTWRPHYHVALFGDFKTEVVDGRYQCVAVETSWKAGFCHVGLLTAESAGYLVRYTTKRMVSVGDDRLGGRTPEFVRMSLRPGIGKLALSEMARGLGERRGAAFLSAKGDVPTEFNVGGKTYSLGRYLSSKLREEVGHDPGMPSGRSLAISAERLRESREARSSKREQHGIIATQRVKSRSSKRHL